MKKIWILNHYATEMFYNKGGRHHYFAKYLIKAGYDVTIFCASARHNGGDNLIEDGRLYYSDEVEGIPYIFVKTRDYKGNGKSRVLNMLDYYFNIKKTASNFPKPDVIIGSSVHPLACVAAINLSKKFKCKNIVEIRDLWPEAIFSFNKAQEKSILGKILVYGEHWIYKRADALIFTKEGDTDYIKEKKWDTKQGGDIDLDKTYYINNGVDIDGFNKCIETKVIEDEDLESGKFNVVYVGAIRPVNNVGNILDAAKLIEDNSGVQFLIYGDGNEKEMLEKRVAAEELNNVKIKGFVNKEFIPYILSQSTVNILNYSQTKYNWRRGNSSNKLFEYMASGKPIISTVKMGYSILDKYNCGIELETSNAEALAKKIIEIKNMTKKEYEIMSCNAKKGAKDFDFEVLTDRLGKVINTVLEEV